jgi:hypothetical protein
MPRPTSLKLGAYTIPIKYHNGYVQCTDDNVTVIEDMSDGDFGMLILSDKWKIHASNRSNDLPVTILHEAIHAMTRTTGVYRLFDNREVEETVVSGLSQAIVELLRRNKGLADYLIAGD